MKPDTTQRPRSYRLWMIGFAGALCLVLFSSCQPFIDQEQTQRSDASRYILSADQSIGQTFVAQHGGLNGIDIWITPRDATSGELRLRLRSDPESDKDIRSVVISTSDIQHSAYHRFSFPAIQDSHGEYYYALLEIVKGEASFEIETAKGDAYLNGALYANHQPRDAQLSFRLSYRWIGIIIDLMGASLTGSATLAASLLLVVLPGWSLLAWLWRGRRLSFGETFGLSTGIGLALYPLLMSWLHYFELNLGPLNVWLPVGFGLVALMWRYRVWNLEFADFVDRLRFREFAPNLALILVVLLGFAVRWIVIRNLDAASWGDSQQHTTIVQLILDHNGLFESWVPYAPFETFSVHMGFHSLVAAFSWFSGMGSVKATLVFGQVINTFAFLTLYPLAMYRRNANRWVGVVCCLIAGLVSPMPAYYVNWGRYPQLAGQAILPVGIYLLLDVIESSRPLNWRHILLTSFTLSGMSLTYYRMPYFLAAFIVPWIIISGIRALVRRAKTHRQSDSADLFSWKRVQLRVGSSDWTFRYWPFAVALVLVGVSVSFLSAFWLHRLLGGKLAGIVNAGVTQATPLSRVIQDYQIWHDIFFYVPRGLVFVLGISLVWGVLAGDRPVLAYGLWILALGSLVATQLINLPGSNVMQNFAILIALYIPVSLIISGPAGTALAQIGRIQSIWGSALALFIILAFSLSFGLSQLSIVDRTYIMVTRPDTHAMAWIRSRTPKNSRFLVEGFHIWGGASAVGSDAGWWIPVMTGRQNTMPPQYALITERPIDVSYPARVVGLIDRLKSVHPASDRSIEALCDFGVTHIFVGQTQGRTSMNMPQLYSPEDFQNQNAVEEVYHRDRVHIYRLASSLCDQ